jgi:heat shock protein HtpX
MLSLALLLTFIGGLVGGRSGVVYAFIFSLIMNFFSYWFSDKMVLSLYRAKELKESDAPEIFEIVKRLTKNANLPMPKIYLIPMSQPNAFATGRSPKHSAVAISQGLLELLNYEEIAGVLAHELSHIKHRDIFLQTIAATFASAISFLAYMARWGAILGGGRNDRDRGGILGLLFMAIFAPIAAMIIQLAISRSREYMADETGAKISQNPLALASALRKLSEYSKRLPIKATPTHNATAHMFIVKPFAGGGLSALFSTHPPIEKRIARLEAMALK